MSTFDRAYCIGVPTVFAVVLFGGIFLGLRADRSGKEEAAIYNAFMSECIERHIEKRCSEFWRFGRTDLGRKQ
jgi:hypothetical protein